MHELKAEVHADKFATFHINWLECTKTDSCRLLLQIARMDMGVFQDFMLVQNCQKHNKVSAVKFV